jgi:hypothetical protein
MPRPLRYHTANLARLLRDTVDTPTMIDPSLKLVQPMQLLVAQGQVDETLMKLFVSSVEKVSTIFNSVVVFTNFCLDGHYANHCPNRNVPGNRGGMDRASQRKFEDD